MADDSQSKRLEAAIELVLRIGAGDLTAQGEVSEASDQLDAIMMGLNMLAEDLAAETKARQRAEELLHDERDAYENAPGLFCSIDPSDLKVLKCNQTLASTLGKAKNSILGKSLLALCPADAHPQLHDVLRQLDGGLHRATCEIRLNKGEECLIVTMSATQIENPRHGKRVRIIFQDITERRLAETLLGSTEQKLQTLFNASPDYLMLFDADHNVTMVNKMMPGLEGVDILGEKLTQFSSSARWQAFKQQLSRIAESGESQQWDSTYTLPDGTVAHFNTVATPIVEAGTSTGIVLSARDTTEQVRLQAEKSDLLEQIRQTQKMEAVGQLAGGVAHDFNNILTAIMGYTSLAQLEFAEGDPMRRWADEVSKASNRAADLTRQLLAFSRQQVTAPKVIDLSELVHNLIPMLDRLIGETVRLKIVSGASVPGVFIDPGQAEQIVLNLAINARDAMPGGGEIVIEATRVTLDSDYVKAHWDTHPGDYVMLAVSDSGSGMTPEIRSKIFEPFFTTKEQGSGTGLGLSTVFGIVKQAEGRLEVYSEVGLGSSFKVYFPVANGAIESLQETPTTAPIGGHETLLVVEDEEMVRDLAEGLLTRLGYTVLPAANGAEAIELCRQHEGEIDALLTDVVMPGHNGKELANAICELRPNIEVLFTSGYPRDIITNQGVLDEGVHFLPKPYSLESLARFVRSVLDR